jgi:subtilisin family serine protease
MKPNLPSNRSSFKRIALTAGVLVAAALTGAATHSTFAQSYDGQPRYRVQSAPAAHPISAPRRAAKPAPIEAQAEAQAKPRTRAVTPQQPAPEQNATRSGTGVPAAGERRFNSNEVVIEVSGRPTPAQVDALARRHRLNREESQAFNLTGTTMFRWTIPDGRNVPNVIRGLEQDPNILSVQPNYHYRLQQQQSRTGEGIQYSVDKLKLPRAHEMAKGDSILIAVIDSGIDPNHPELLDTIADSFNPAGGDGAPHSHGTGIAGCIVAQSRLTGVAPRARILAVRAFDPNGGGAEGTTFNILKGLEWASEKGARVINMSFAGPQDPIIGRALAAANKKGIVLVAAVGNAGPKSPPLYPAADTNVIAVTATDSQDRLYQGSNRGNHVAVAAPGVDVILPAPGTSYQMSTGTSFAAAHISGIVALILEREPSLTPDSVRRVLLSTAHDLGPAGRDKDFGAGLADAYDALISIGKPGDALQAVHSAPK